MVAIMWREQRREDMTQEILVSVEDVVTDIKTVIKKEGKDEIRYDLPNDNTLIVYVIADPDDTMEIVVERLDEFGNTIECATDDYDCDDKTLTAMVENALML